MTKKQRLTDAADSSDMSDIIILDTYTQVIDLTAERDNMATPPDAVAMPPDAVAMPSKSPAEVKSPAAEASKRKGSRQKQMKGKKKGLPKQRQGEVISLKLILQYNLFSESSRMGGGERERGGGSCIRKCLQMCGCLCFGP